MAKVFSLKNDLARIADALTHQQEEFVNAWMNDFIKSPLHYQSIPTIDELRVHVRGVLEELRDALSSGRSKTPLLDLRPGMSELNGVEKTLSFLGAHLSGLGMNGYDLFALFMSLRSTLDGVVSERHSKRVGRYVEWMMAISFDAMANARELSAIEKHKDQLDDGTPLFLLPSEIPVLCLVGDPSSRGIGGLLGRLLMMCVQTASCCAVIHFDGCSHDTESLCVHLNKFLDHPKIGEHVTLLLVGALELKSDLNRHESKIEWLDRMDEAVNRAFEISGMCLYPKR